MLKTDPNPSSLAQIERVLHEEGWRGLPFTVNFLILDRDVGAEELVAIYRWAARQGLDNPRVIAPQMLAWSALFHPALHTAICRNRTSEITRRMEFVDAATIPEAGALELLWLQSIAFLAGVTLSTAIIEGRWSKGTIESKLDRLWQIASSTGLPKHFDADQLKSQVRALGHGNLAPIDLLLSIRSLYLDVVRALSSGVSANAVVSSAQKDVSETKFGFAFEFAGSLHGLSAVVVYGSSLSSPDYADIDVILVVDDAEAVLRQLEGTRPRWNDKELNLGVYTPRELWQMQLLSGDNLADYGRCVWGSVRLPEKPKASLLARNFSFGMVRQRQQLGMLARSLSPMPDDGDDRRNLYSYFVKIPANVVKGTYGAVARRLSKTDVSDWLVQTSGFHTAQEQALVKTTDATPVLARAALATGDALVALNAELRFIRPCLEGARL